MFSIKDCGLMVEPQLGMSMDELADSAKIAEDQGFGYFFRSDHLLPTDNRRGLDSPECWTSLGVVAAHTSKVKFGPMVSPIGFRNPALLAKMACTLHSYSKGRLQLSIGAGWYEAEYKAHGYPFPDFKGRMAQFREALTIITALVRDGRADFDGKFFSAHTDCYPRPSGQLHLIIGARTKPLVRLAAQSADEWNFFHLPTEVFRELKGVLDAASGGRKIVVSEMGPFMIGRNQADLEESARLQAAQLGQDLSPKEVLESLRSRNAPCGTLDEFVNSVRAILDSGVHRLYFQSLVPSNTSMVELLADTLKGGI
jgi:alkanesulfonate monooxygenase SsuD/methylene tetrahydromethanopterin reductase-like flavin-dependent oxidoreductase (luciferase family)